MRYKMFVVTKGVKVDEELKIKLKAELDQVTDITVNKIHNHRGVFLSDDIQNFLDGMSAWDSVLCDYYMDNKLFPFAKFPYGVYKKDPSITVQWCDVD